MTTKKTMAIIAACLGSVGVSQAQGVVQVTHYNDSGAQLNTETFANDAPVSVSVHTAIGSVKVVASPTSGDIGRITVSGTTDNYIDLFVTSDMTGGSTPPATTGCRELAGVTDTTGDVRLKGRLSGDLTGDIDVGSLVYLIVGDEIEAPIVSAQGGMQVEAARVGTAGDITVEVGPITLVKVTTGDLLGDIKALDGSITTIDIQTGDIGSSTNTVAIEASAAAASGYHIQSIHVNRHLYANVDCNSATPSTADGAMQVFHVGDINNASTTGDFHVSIKLGHFTNHMTMMRDCYATINHGDALAAGSTTVPLRILIGRSLKTGAQVNLPSLGLNGFVMIARLLDSGTGTWDGTVNVGTNALNVYNYSTLASSLGRGGAGLTPYRLHNSSCIPANGATEVIAAASLASVRLRHYGPLSWNSANGVPAAISRLPICTAGSYATVTTSTSNFALADDNAGASEAPCNLIVTLAFETGYQYKITPTGALRCFTPGTENIPVQWDTDYIINVRSKCFADMNASGQVNIDDLLSVINL